MKPAILFLLLFFIGISIALTISLKQSRSDLSELTELYPEMIITAYATGYEAGNKDGSIGVNFLDTRLKAFANELFTVEEEEL